jgi:uncharacterized protein (TIGR02302 family)
MTEIGRQVPDPSRSGLKRRIAGMRAVGYAVLLIERLLITALPALGVGALFLVISWFGLWRMMPPLAKGAVTAALLVALCAALLRFRNFRLPGQSSVDRRLEERSGLAHQAISIQTDVPVGNDPFSLALWKTHQERMAKSISAIDSGGPAPDIARHDPFALRALAVLGLIVAWTFSWSNYGGRVADMFDYSRQTIAGTGLRIDAWVTPPTYTAVAPIYLSGMQAKVPDEPIRVPQFSELTIRISGKGSDAPVRFNPAGKHAPVVLTAEKAEATDGNQPVTDEGASHTYKVKLARDGDVSVDNLSFAFLVTPDRPPTISFTKEPGRAVNGALEVAFEAKDDYGVAEARAEILPVESDAEAIPLFAAPEFRLDSAGW